MPSLGTPEACGESTLCGRDLPGHPAGAALSPTVSAYLLCIFKEAITLC